MKQVYPLTIQSGMSQSGSYLLMLQEPQSGTQIPIIIGQYEAQSILLAKESVKARRPMTHELMVNMMRTYGLTIEKVTIDSIRDGIFYSTIHMSDNMGLGEEMAGNYRTLDSRTSDAITLALLYGAPIMIEEAVIEETGVVVDAKPKETLYEDMSIDELERELRQCEESEEYERAAEIQKIIDNKRR